MLVLGIMGSPRKKGNTSILLDACLQGVQEAGGRIYRLEAAEKDITPCVECLTCEKKSYCPINDEMQDVYPLLWQADVVILSTPIFFYSPPAKVKGLIDRSQAMWSQKYRHKLEDPGRPWRKGYLLALGATKGKNLFEGTILTAKYFYDAVGAKYCGGLTYRQIESAGEIKEHPTALDEAREAGQELTKTFTGRKKVLFVCRENACRSQMAAAFTRYYFGDRFEARSAGSHPAEKINPLMFESMQKKGISMAYQSPQHQKTVLQEFQPELIVTMGCEDKCPYLPGVEYRQWDLTDPSDQPYSVMRQVRDEIEQKIKAEIATELS